MDIDMIFNLRWVTVYMHLKLRSYHQKSVGKRSCEKLSPRYYGPFKVASKVGIVAYILELSHAAAIHPMFQASQLRNAIGSSQPIYSLYTALL